MAIDSYIISTPRLGLRKWIGSDLDPFIKLNKDPDVMKFFPKALSEEESIDLIKRIGRSFADNDFGLFAVEDRSTKEFLGFTGFARPSFESSFMPCIEIGWRFKKEVWGKGYATEAAKACLHHGFNILGFEKIFSFTSIVNVNSEKVMQRTGMTKITEFDHPGVERGQLLCRHVLYRIDKTRQLSADMIFQRDRQ